MSWSVSAVGKAASVAAKLAADFTKYPCGEPEETIRQLAANVIATSLAAFPPASAVRVDACGSQSGGDSGKVNNLILKIEPLYGFVE